MSEKDLLRQWIRSALSSSRNVFDSLLDQFRGYVDKPANTISEFKRRTTKSKGDLFEIFCVLYLEALEQYDKVWLLKEVPSDILAGLKLRRADCGIDIIAHNSQGYAAVQCKLRLNPSRNKMGFRTHVVGWKALSTFYALCSRTGPWVKHVVMTNCESVSSKGLKTDSDATMAKTRFTNTPRDMWMKMAGMKGVVLVQSESKETKLSIEEMRAKRVLALTGKTM